MKISQNGLEFIKKHEGLRLKSYLDAVGVKTIGYGHAFKPGERFNEPISVEEAHLLLLQDVAIAENAINRLIVVSLSQNQFDALCSFTFNLGAGALQRSTLRMKLNRKEYAPAADEFLRWSKGKIGGAYKILPGLLKRRKEERALFLIKDELRSKLSKNDSIDQIVLPEETKKSLSQLLAEIFYKIFK